MTFSSYSQFQKGNLYIKILFLELIIDGVYTYTPPPKEEKLIVISQYLKVTKVDSF